MTSEYPNLEETIQAYVLEKLPFDKKNEFEEYFLARPDVIEQIEIAQKVHLLADFDVDQSPDTEAETIESRDKVQFIDKLLGWFTIPVPAFATVAAIALLAPIMANQFAGQETGQIELAAFSSATTRGDSQSNTNKFDVVVDLSRLKENAAIMIKVTPDVKQTYQLEVHNASELIWTSSPFAVKSGTRDQIVLLPDSVRIPNANLRLLGKEQDGSFRAVKFCNYSEVCR